MAAATASFALTRLLSTPKSLSISTTTTALLPSATFSRLRSNTTTSSPFSLRLRPHHLIPATKFSTTHKISAILSVGDKLPESTFSYFDSDGELQTTTVSDLTKSKKAILFAVPGAFTPTCSQKHLPGFVEKSAELKAKGVDTIACISVNDAFVIDHAEMVLATTSVPCVASFLGQDASAL